LEAVLGIQPGPVLQYRADTRTAVDPPGRGGSPGAGADRGAAPRTPVQRLSLRLRAVELLDGGGPDGHPPGGVRTGRAQSGAGAGGAVRAALARPDGPELRGPHRPEGLAPGHPSRPAVHGCDLL